MMTLHCINTWVSMNILLHWDSSKPRILCHVARVAARKSPQAQIMDAILWCASGGCFSRISFVTNGQNRKRRFRTRTVGIVGASRVSRFDARLTHANRNTSPSGLRMVRPRARVRAPKGAVFFSGVGVRRGTLSSATRRGTEPRRFQKNKARVTKSATRAARQRTPPSEPSNPRWRETRR